MSTRVMALCAAIAAAAAIGGCRDEEEEMVTLSGQVTYDDYQSGVIVLKVCESETSVYTSGGDVFSKSPGDCLKTLVLDAPGEFEVKQTFTWVSGREPDIDLLAYLVPSEETDLESCGAGAALTLSLADHDAVDLILITDECPARQ
jgi:hypothetical protein